MCTEPNFAVPQKNWCILLAQWIVRAWWRDPGQNLSQRCAEYIVNSTDTDIASSPTRRVRSKDRDHDRPPHHKGPTMADKSPRQSMSKKSGKSLKEKRAVKRAKSAESSSTDNVLHPKKH
ncbi:hypothetical protein MMAGJ_40610 [Mycolicibacterium mageritense]|uniref:Uncharacterized protein n=2 Tax=Mycolicibacterium mageritense TaxID=53462 RepID=A0ABM7HVZ0_MYCME|nr:hypothetical protein MMAGJ_40610 [Mycolicibacterium mageritense]GJJ21301.1 hypothetical protein MTY414_49740 [Mycolicibacterium mageritense]